jgi:hypothetical protein
VGAAALPRGPAQGRADRGHKSGVSIRGDELDPGQAAGDQVAEERQPAGAVLAGGDVQAEDLAVPVVVHAGRDEGMHAHDAATFAHLQDEGVGGDESERPGVGQGAGAELLHVGVELLGHLRHLGLRQRRDPQRGQQLVHPAGGHAEQEQVATTLVSARSARLRRSSSHCGKEVP